MAELSTAQKARVASRAQAAAHRVLREMFPERYQDAYRAAKEKLTAEELAKR